MNPARKITIRSALPQDLPAVRALESLSFQDPWSDESLLEELSPDPRRAPLVLELDGRVQGVALVWVVADELHLVSLAVHPRHRRQGLATRLLDELVARGRRGSMRLITLEVRYSNAAARAFYRRHGFLEVAMRPRYYSHPSEDALVLLRQLDGSSPADGAAPPPGCGT